MTYPEPYAKDIFEAIAYTLTITSHMVTGTISDMPKILI